MKILFMSRASGLLQLIVVRELGVVQPLGNDASLVVQRVRNLDGPEWRVFYTSTATIWQDFESTQEIVSSGLSGNTFSGNYAVGFRRFHLS
jgi:hypothetical protein